MLALVRDLSTGTLTFTDEVLSAACESGAKVLAVGLGGSPPRLGCPTATVAGSLGPVADRAGFMQAWRFVLAAMQLRPVVRSFRPHLIFAQGLDELALVAVLSSSFYHVPAVSFVHDLTLSEFEMEGAGWSRTRLLVQAAWLRQRFTAQRLAKVFVASSLMKRSISDCLGVDSEVVPLAAPRDFSVGGGSRRRRPFTTLFYGTLTPKKDPWTLLRAFAALKGLDVRLRIVGDGRARADLVHAAATLGISDRVDFLGWISRRDLVSEVQRSHVCVVPSLWEGFGLTVVEAASSGVPVIVTRNVGAAELLRDGESGFVVSAGDAEAIASRVRALYDDEELWNRMSARCTELGRGLTWKQTFEGLRRGMMEVVS
jgi:glycosyltransferase involved in cell wall biosynthesis